MSTFNQRFLNLNRFSTISGAHLGEPFEAFVMTITLHAPDIRELKPRITVFGVGGAAEMP